MRRIFLLRPAGVLGASFTVAVLLIWFALRPWYTNWGATAAEAQRVLPGDELIAAPLPMSLRTKAITINATPAEIWPWLVQMGQGRGGLYSYEWLENALGMEMHNADQIIPELQQLQIGDPIRMGPEGKAPPPFLVAQIVPGRALVIGHRNAQKSAWRDTYAFVLEPIDAQHTRLLHRNRAAEQFGIDRALEPGYFLMERGMLLGIRQRAERNRGLVAQQ